MHVRVSDGTRLAVDVWNVHRRSPQPAILVPCRYWRGARGQFEPDPELVALAHHGYSLVLVDVRGTGASYGTWHHPHSHREIAELAEVAAWVRRQPWCDGRLVATGRSYGGNDAELLAGAGVRGLRAVIADSPDHDLYRDLVFPGGVAATWFTAAWTTLTACLDGRRGAPAGDAVLAEMLAAGPRPAGRLLGLLHRRLARRQHRRGEPLGMLDHDFCADDVLPGTDVTLDELSTRSIDRSDALRRVPLLVRASWYDAATSAGALRRWERRLARPWITISATSHGGLFTADPFSEPMPTSAQSRADEAAAFLEEHVCRERLAPKAWPGGEAPSQRIYTVGSGAWSTYDVWPPSGVVEQAWFLSPNAELTQSPAVVATSEQYDVDWLATSGTANRWHTQIGGGPVRYPSVDDRSSRLVRFTSPALGHELSLAGTPSLELRIAIDGSDAAIFAAVHYLDRSGALRWITDGQLRMAHRAGTFRRADLQPIRAGEVVHVRLRLLPACAVLPAGGRLRLSLAGHDAGSFARYPRSGNVRWSLRLGGLQPSTLLLPIRA
jgi:putative CocE/NonD family hydrolase